MAAASQAAPVGFDSRFLLQKKRLEMRISSRFLRFVAIFQNLPPNCPQKFLSKMPIILPSVVVLPSTKWCSVFYDVRRGLYRWEKIILRICAYLLTHSPTLRLNKTKTRGFFFIRLPFVLMTARPKMGAPASFPFT